MEERDGGRGHPLALPMRCLPSSISAFAPVITARRETVKICRNIASALVVSPVMSVLRLSSGTITLAQIALPVHRVPSSVSVSHRERVKVWWNIASVNVNLKLLTFVNSKLHAFGEIAQRFEGDLRYVLLPRREAAEPIMSLGLAACPRPLGAAVAAGVRASGSCYRGY